MPKSAGLYEFSTECMVFGERSSVFHLNCSVKSHCFVGAAHVRPAAIWQTAAYGKAEGRACPAPTVRLVVGVDACIDLRGVGDAAPYFYRFFSCSSSPSRGVT